MEKKNDSVDCGLKWYVESLWPELPEEERNFQEMTSVVKENSHESALDNLFNLWVKEEYPRWLSPEHQHINVVIVTIGINIDYMKKNVAKNIDWLHTYK